QGIGHWLAIMRLLGGCDFHAENMIAHRSSPVIVDCETLFTPKIKPLPSGYGQAFDNAAELIAGTVLNVGILPGRGMALGWHGVDSSAVGMLPDQQPLLTQLSIEGAGSDEAHIKVSLINAPNSMNHPSPRPELAHFWPDVLMEFDLMTKTLHRLDNNGTLRIMLDKFADCRIRFVPRSTEVYAELGRMLWHPVSLHNETQARRHVFNLLEKMATNVPSAPNKPDVINAEIDELMVGDIPMFTTSVGHGQLDGPQGTHWLSPENLICSTLQHWRVADVKLDIAIIRASLVSAYINDGWTPTEVSLLPEYPRTGELETRRRRLIVNIIDELKSTTIRGQDGTVTWIAPTLNGNSWSVQPLGQDLYSGISGVALLIAAYLREVSADRADAVTGLEVFVCIYTSNFN
ncbi:Lanthionine synthetase C family protein, partial [mine drainage metagenome]